MLTVWMPAFRERVGWGADALYPKDSILLDQVKLMGFPYVIESVQNVMYSSIKILFPLDTGALL
jgi:hypothetical protein